MIQLERCPTCLMDVPIEQGDAGPIAVCPLHGKVRWRAVLTAEDYASADAARLLSMARRHHRTDAAPERTVRR